MAKAVLFFATGTEECEALLVADLLRRSKVEVVIASISGQKTVVGGHAITIVADALAKEISYENVDVIILPGGMPGTSNLGENETVIKVAKQFMQQNKMVAAICAAPAILGDLGLIEGRKVTSHAAFHSRLVDAIVENAEVVVDGNLTTACGLGSAIPFALKLIEQLCTKEEAIRLKKAIA